MKISISECLLFVRNQYDDRRDLGTRGSGGLCSPKICKCDDSVLLFRYAKCPYSVVPPPPLLAEDASNGPDAETLAGNCRLSNVGPGVDDIFPVTIDL